MTRPASARDAERVIGLALIGYELAALATGRVPTLTELARAHRRWAVPAVTALLAAHLWLYPDHQGLPDPGGICGSGGDCAAGRPAV